jgi:hypothetical protein
MFLFVITLLLLALTLLTTLGGECVKKANNMRDVPDDKTAQPGSAYKSLNASLHKYKFIVMVCKV